MHAFVRAFFGAHSFSLNVEKSEFLCSDQRALAMAPPLASVDGQHLIQPRQLGHTIRYLGVWLNLDLNWDTETRRIDRLVRRVCARMLTHGFTHDMSAYVVQGYLMPRVRAAVLVIPMTRAFLRLVDDWDLQIRRAAMRASRMHQSAMRWCPPTATTRLRVSRACGWSFLRYARRRRWSRRS